jgi:TPR repeat protein
MLYSLGEGTPKDNIEAYRWFYRAMQHDIPEDQKRTDLRDNLQWLEKHMEPKDVDEARRRAIHSQPGVLEPKPQPTPDAK